MNKKAKAQKLGLLFVRYLMASYLYYLHDEDCPWTDHDFDSACKKLHKGWDDFEHRHKYLTTKEAMGAGTGHHIRAYPMMVESSAWQWKREGKK